MNSKKNASNERLVKLMLSLLAMALFGSAGVEQVLAQVSTDIVASNSFSVPVVKAVPNPCTSRFVLITGSETVQIATTQSSTGEFNIKINLSGSGKGEDALADGTLITDGTQRPKYNYSSGISAEVDFPSVPSYFLLTVPIKDYLQRESVTDPKADSFIMKTSLELTLNNGVPTVPIIRSIALRCE